MMTGAEAVATKIFAILYPPEACAHGWCLLEAFRRSGLACKRGKQALGGKGCWELMVSGNKHGKAAIFRVTQASDIVHGTAGYAQLFLFSAKLNYILVINSRYLDELN